MSLKYDSRGLVPAIIQDASTREVLMLGYINEESLKVTPMARWGTPSDMAGVALFLGSQASAYLCGSIITVDGGYATTA